MAATFPRSARLTTARGFDRVFQNARRSKDEWFTVLARSGASDGPRLGLAIGKRVDRRAVARNRLKRLVREGFRRQREQLPALDFVVLARPAAVRASGQQLLDSLSRHFTRLGDRMAGEPASSA